MTVCHLQEHQLYGVDAVLNAFFSIEVVEYFFVPQTPLCQNYVQDCVPFLNLEEQQVEENGRDWLLHQGKTHQVVSWEVEAAAFSARAETVVEDDLTVELANGELEHLD